MEIIIYNTEMGRSIFIYIYIYIYIYNKHSYRASLLVLHWRRKRPKHSQGFSHSCSAVVVKFSGFKDARRQLCLKVSWPLSNFLSSSWV